MKTVYLSKSLIPSIDWEDYHKHICVWEYSSVEDALKAAIEGQPDDIGMTHIFFDTYESMMELPTHVTRYMIDEKEVSLYEYECSDVGYEINEVIHSVEWTKSLGIEKQYRLAFELVGNRGDVAIIVDWIIERSSKYEFGTTDWKLIQVKGEPMSMPHLASLKT